MATNGGGLRTDSSDYRVELLSPAALAENGGELPRVPSWRLSMDSVKLPERHTSTQFGLCYLINSLSKQIIFFFFLHAYK